MNIAIIGIGGVGGYFGGKLTQLLQDEKDLNIYFIARNQHLREIQTNGLTLDTDVGQIICKPTRASDDISELPPLDLCFICVKCYSLADILVQLQSKISDKSMLLPLLNGVDIYERIRSIIPNGIVFPACVYVGTHIERPGKVTQRGGACTIHFGKDPSHDEVPAELFRLLQSVDIKYRWTENPYPEIWSKFIFIAAFGIVTAYSNQTIGAVLQSAELSRDVKEIMTEIYQIAMKKGISLPATIVNDSYQKANNFPFETKTSFQRDYENLEKPDERDIFGGTIIRLGEQLGIKTETTRKIYHWLHENKTL